MFRSRSSTVTSVEPKTLAVTTRNRSVGSRWGNYTWRVMKPRNHGAGEFLYLASILNEKL